MNRYRCNPQVRVTNGIGMPLLANQMHPIIHRQCLLVSEYEIVIRKSIAATRISGGLPIINLNSFSYIFQNSVWITQK